MTFLLALLLQIAYPTPPPPPAVFLAVQQAPLPSHRVGPHDGEPGATCYRGETVHPAADRTLYHCECKLICLPEDCGQRREDDNCETSCSHGTQCLCHADEQCELVDHPEPKR
jgi:hypothetical protein